MPGSDRKIDPITKDYIDDDSGSWETTTDISTMVYHQLRGKLNHWTGDATAGSTVYTFKRTKASRGEVERFKDAIRLAVNPFIENGWAADFVIEVTVLAPGRWEASGRLKDIQNSTEVNITPLLPGGA